MFLCTYFISCREFGFGDGHVVINLQLGSPDMTLLTGTVIIIELSPVAIGLFPHEIHVTSIKGERSTPNVLQSFFSLTSSLPCQCCNPQHPCNLSCA